MQTNKEAVNIKAKPEKPEGGRGGTWSLADTAQSSYSKGHQGANESLTPLFLWLDMEMKKEGSREEKDPPRFKRSFPGGRLFC